MNSEFQLKIQAFLDSELPPHKATEVAEWIAKNREASMLMKELRQTRALMTGNEVELKLPVAKDFFWSQIEREINSSENRKEIVKPVIEVGWIWRLLAPASALLLLAVLILPQRHTVTSELASTSNSEVETAIDEANVVTFRSDLEGVSVVWVEMD